MPRRGGSVGTIASSSNKFTKKTTRQAEIWRDVGVDNQSFALQSAFWLKLSTGRLLPAGKPGTACLWGAGFSHVQSKIRNGTILVKKPKRGLESTKLQSPNFTGEWE